MPDAAVVGRDRQEQTVVDPVADSRAEVIRNFAHDLRDLRVSAGSPSFRDMAGHSHAISHTTLHEAAQGNRFPSWSTTVEFVKACGADPSDFRERWTTARRAVRAPGGGVSTATPDPAPSAGNDDAAPPAEPTPPVDQARPSARRLRTLLLAGAGAIAVAAAVVVIAASGGDTTGPKGGSGAGPSLTAADCPHHQTDPPSAAPAHPGDADYFAGDITVPDCTHLARGTTVPKVWRFQNTGTVLWRGYMLHRVDQPQDRGDCQTISDVPIADTPPGRAVDVRVEVTTPRRPGFCFVRFMIEDAAGRTAFPAKRPVNFQIIVD